MLSMRPIDEPDVIASLNQGRYPGPVEGYIMMDGPVYQGYALFRVQDGVTTVLEGDLKDKTLLDGILRACVAAGQNRGAERFAVNREQENLARWWDVFCKGTQPPAPVAQLFGGCDGGGCGPGR